jgi:hypothetical protein
MQINPHLLATSPTTLECGNQPENAALPATRLHFSYSFFMPVPVFSLNIAVPAPTQRGLESTLSQCRATSLLAREDA